jgi:outer membrane protein assembly factor BamB
VTLGVALAAPAAAEDDPWAMDRRDPRGSASSAWAAGPSLPEWHYARLSQRKYRDGIPVWASTALAVVDGRPLAFLGGCDHTLHALDLAAKEQAWAKVTNGPIAAAPAVGLVAGEPVVFFASADRTLYACFARDGSRLWSRELFPPSSTSGDAVLGAPLLHGGEVYVTAFAYDRALPRSAQSGRLIALERATGRRRWSIEVSQGPVSSPVGREIGGRLLVFVAARKGLLSCVDASAEVPVVRWRYQMPHEVLGSPTLAAAGGRELLYLGSKYGNLVALDAATGHEVWKRMAGNWIDNSVAVGDVGGAPVVFAGSHDYKVHAFDAESGEVRWTRGLGGEVFSAPALFTHRGRPALVACCLDDHAYVLDAATGAVLTSFFTGTPLWDKVSKGDVLWGSPAVVEAGSDAAIVLGAYSGTVYVLPVAGECSLRTTAWSPSGLWVGLLVVAGIFLLGVLPLVLRLPVPVRAGDGVRRA